MRRLLSLVLISVFVVSIPTWSQQNSSSKDVEVRVDSMLKQLSLEEKIDLIGGVDDFYIREIPHIGLPRLKMADGPFGVRNYGPSTTLGGLGLAASWDTALAERVGRTIGQDARARGVHFMLGPGVNIYRAPMNGRNFEYFGEDPFLASRTAVAYIEGMQSQGVSATIKHYMGNNSEFLRHDSDSVIDERTMHEIYLPTFEAAVKEAHVGAIMDSYNFVNGVHASQNSKINIDIARKDWGFDGIIMSDWDSTYDGVAAANGGLDLEMPSGKFMNRATLLPAVKSGKLPVAVIDEKVRHILSVATRFGWLDHAQTDPSISLLNMEGREVALEASRSAMVLLKNDRNLLPLNRDAIKSLAIIGPNAYPAQPVGGGSAGVVPFTAVSYLEGITSYVGKTIPVFYHPGLPSVDDMTSAPGFSADAAGQKAGLTAEFFNNIELSGKPAATRVEPRVNYMTGFGEGTKENNVSARWSGYYTPKIAGDHVVFVESSGEGTGYRLYLDDKLVIDTWKLTVNRLSYKHVSLPAGPHKVRLEFFGTWTWGGAKIKAGIVNTASLVDPAVKELASHVDAVVIAVGFDLYSESEGGDRTFSLPPGQDELIQAITAANKNTVVVITSGGGVDMTRWIDRVPAVIQAWFPGQEGGHAFAQLLFGDYSPSGRLPISVEKRWEDSAVHDSYYPKGADNKVTYSEGVFLGYRHFDKSGIKPLFPFGYGLSYTTFSFGGLNVSSGSTGIPVMVSFDVTNTGKRAAAEVAQVYVGDRHSGIPRPVKELKGFTKVFLNPGESRRVSVSLDRRAFSYYDVGRHAWTVSPGDFDIYVGSSSANIELTGKVTLQAD